MKGPDEGMRAVREAIGYGTGERFAFEPVNGVVANGASPLSVEGGDFKMHDI